MNGKLVRCTPILIMMPGVQGWFSDPARMRAFVAEFNENHGFNGGDIGMQQKPQFTLRSLMLLAGS